MVQVEGMAPLLAVFDMPAALKFYCDILGFQMVSTSPGRQWVMLNLNGVVVMLNTAYDEGERPPEVDQTRVAAHEDTSLYFGCSNVDAIYEHLRAHGTNVKPPRVVPYGMKQVYVNDPDGYLLCFQHKAEHQSTSD